MSIAVYGFLISERGAFFPSASIAKALFPELALLKIVDPEAPLCDLLSRCPCCATKT